MPCGTVGTNAGHCDIVAQVRSRRNLTAHLFNGALGVHGSHILGFDAVARAKAKVLQSVHNGVGVVGFHQSFECGELNFCHGKLEGCCALPRTPAHEGRGFAKPGTSREPGALIVRLEWDVVSLHIKFRVGSGL